MKKKFFDYGVHSAPLWNPETNQANSSIDVLDLLSFVLAVPKDENWEKNLKQQFTLPVTLAKGFSGANPFLPVLDKTPVKDVITDFFSKGVYRVPVVNQNRQMTHILSQFDVLLFTRQRFSDLDLKDLADRKLKDLNSFSSTVLTVSISSTLLEAFEVLRDNKITGVAVIDKEKKIVGNISASDFEGICEDNCMDLKKTVKTFLSQQKPFVVTLENTFQQVVNILATSFVHRVFIVDKYEHPIGCLTVTDIMIILRNELFSGVDDFMDE